MRGWKREYLNTFLPFWIFFLSRKPLKADFPVIFCIFKIRRHNNSLNSKIVIQL